MGRPRAGRPAQLRADGAHVGQLSLEEILAAALELTHKDGVDSFTMRDLAERVGGSPASLYHYVPSKRRLKELIADAVIDMMQLPDALDGSWDDKLRAMLLGQHRLVSDYPGVGLLYIRERPTAAMLRITDAMLQLLLSTGVPARDALRCFEALTALAFGQYVTDLRHPRSKDDVRARLRNVAPAELAQFPGVMALQAEIDSREPEDYFEHSVDLLLTGIRAKVAELTVGLQSTVASRHT
jgi:AcrR family transcriptional regulator